MARWSYNGDLGIVPVWVASVLAADILGVSRTRVIGLVSGYVVVCFWGFAALFLKK